MTGEQLYEIHRESMRLEGIHAHPWPALPSQDRAAYDRTAAQMEDAPEGMMLIPILKPDEDKAGVITVTVFDHDNMDPEDADTQVLEDYVITVKAPFYVAHRNMFSNGTTVITVKRDD